MHFSVFGDFIKIYFLYNRHLIFFKDHQIYEIVAFTYFSNIGKSNQQHVFFFFSKVQPVQVPVANRSRELRLLGSYTMDMWVR